MYINREKQLFNNFLNPTCYSSQQPKQALYELIFLCLYIYIKRASCKCVNG